ncbi:MAG TPA: ABC transporter permease [Puia sp.]|nr:ABC transporter permease [Puia sp.]
MFKSHLKIACRNIIGHKGYSLINVLGLSLGIAACIVIYLITSYDLSFDTFHPDKKRIYRILGEITEPSGDKIHFASVPNPVSSAARQDLSGLDAIAGIIPYRATISVPLQPSSHFDNTTRSLTGIAEPSWFTIFRYDWLAGNPSTALNEPFTVVLTESKARLYFGSGPLQEMLGRIVVYDDSLQVHVSGIVKDWIKSTDFPFTDFISAATIQSSFLKNSLTTESWKAGDRTTWVFAKLSKGTAPAVFSSQLNALIKRRGDPVDKLTLSLEPLADVHFNANVVESSIRVAHLPTLYALMGIAVFILLIAAINFINLSTAQSIRRAKEVGVRKVLGGSRVSLVWQFLTETFLLTLLAVLMAVAGVRPILTAFQSFIPAGVSFHPFDPPTLSFLLSVTIVTSFLAGIYPAKVLSAYVPAMVLKGSGVQKGGGKWYLRKGLIVFQFTVSLVFVIGSLVIASQLNYMRHKDLGFKTDAIINVGTPRGDSLTKIKVAAEKIRQLSGVSQVALEWLPPVDHAPRVMAIKLSSADQKPITVGQVAGNEDFIPLYHLRLLAGRNLEPSDSVKEFVINESFSQIMGCRSPQKAIGRTIYWNNKAYPVVGVVADFHGSSLHEPIRPLCIINRVEREGNLAIELASKGQSEGAVKALLVRIETAWKSVYPAGTFQFGFFDESIALLYEKDRQTATLMNTAMFITIFISCIGLFGLAMYSAETKTKEIGIRKILGASVANIAVMLSKEFLLLITIAALIASPIAWYFMNRWLADFAYRIAIHWWIFLLAGLSAIVVALATVSYQSVKAALMNPVKSLRSE